jgi:hypothetical protein
MRSKPSLIRAAKNRCSGDRENRDVTLRISPGRQLKPPLRTDTWTIPRLSANLFLIGLPIGSGN